MRRIELGINMFSHFVARSAAALSVVFVCSTASAATVIKVDNLGSIFNESVSFPSTKTPGSSKLFEDFFEFYLPQAQYVSASMSISGPTGNQIPKNQGHLILADWTSTGPGPLHIPSGATIEEATVSPPSKGGQTAVVGTDTPLGDLEPAGYYFVEVAGKSGGGALQLAVDGNVTAVVPEPSTWAMFGLGFGALAMLGVARRKADRERARYAF
jgi:hypothetical protein